MNEHDRNDDDQVEPIDFVEPPHPDLSKISGEMAALTLPDVDAAKMEAALFARLAREPVPGGWRGGRLALPLAAAAIAAAALGLLSFRATRPIEANGAIPVAGASVVAAATPEPASASATQPQPRLSAGAEEVRFVRDGLATLVLEPGASARVVRDDDVLTIDLERGALRAYVVPRLEKERVVVLSNGVRIAVHGTVFRVARAGEATDVDVLRGTVSVGSTNGDAGRAPQILEAPRGLSVLSGVLEQRAARPFAEIAGPWLEPRATKVSSVDKAAPKGADEALRARVVALANDCFRQETSRLAPGVDVQASSTVVVKVGDNGRVSSIAFVSPLAPGLQQCIRAGVSNEHGTPGTTDVGLVLARR